MIKPLSEDKRREIMRLYVAGVPTAEIAKAFGMSASYPSQLAARLNVTRRVQHEPRDPEAAAEKRHARAEAAAKVKAAPPKPEPSLEPMNVNSAAEIRRLFGMGRKRTEIAALLRCPYRVVDAALA
ncbi:hypothetical protein C8D77_11197 [Mesorhizobium loti]|uniref:Uncharacterized protein n=1 Tax=Rhizobium loti TaxID=381 RepID=A0A8E3B2D6_RHILI|nr:hypothetical protein [Mesorhizobium loti]PWJ88375.1 hypothetical protein C8D77_11197 [Mesorhizobium loti]